MTGLDIDCEVKSDEEDDEEEDVGVLGKDTCLGDIGKTTRVFLEKEFDLTSEVFLDVES
jgi:hypothetical protein